MNRILLIITITIFSFFEARAQVSDKPANQNAPDTTRIERAEKKYQELFGAKPNLSNSNDPELMSILQKLIFGETFYIGNLDDKTRELY